MKLEHYQTPYTKTNSKWIKDLSLRLDTVKLLEENRGRTHLDINCNYIFLDPPPRVTKINTQINKWDLMKLKGFCTAKETVSKMEGQPPGWEKIFVNKTASMGLISKIHQELYVKNKNNQKIGGGHK